MLKRFVYVPSTFGMFMGRGYGKKRTKRKRCYGLLYGRGNDGNIIVKQVEPNEVSLLTPEGKQIITQAETNQKPVIIEDDEELHVLQPIIDAGKFIGKLGKKVISTVGDGIMFTADVIGRTGWKPADFIEAGTVIMNPNKDSEMKKWGKLIGETTLKCLPIILPFLL